MAKAQAAATCKAGESVAVVLEHDPHAPTAYQWSVHCPLIPSCFSEGRTREEAVQHIREVLRAYWELQGEELRDRDVVIVELAP